MMELTGSTELFATLALAGSVEERKRNEFGSLRIEDVPDMMFVAEELFEENVDKHDNWEFTWMEHSLEGSPRCHRCGSHDDVLMRGINQSGTKVMPTCGDCMAQKETYRMRDFFVPSLGRLNEIRNGYVGRYDQWVPGIDIHLELALIQGGKAY
tara:strand:+ start:2994 stop:3455 length:462 start_codon:yes stop_codon:yes gene_type:complete